MTSHKEWVVELFTLASVGVLVFLLIVALYNGCQHRPVPAGHIAAPLQAGK